jgi:hypothetical protein
MACFIHRVVGGRSLLSVDSTVILSCSKEWAFNSLALARLVCAFKYWSFANDVSPTLLAMQHLVPLKIMHTT